SNELSYLFHVNMYVAGLAHIPLFAVGWIPVAVSWHTYTRHLLTHPVVHQPVRRNVCLDDIASGSHLCIANHGAGFLICHA
ncbi:MAG: hypothetical protein KDK34_13595, partial [Leptospiraceae bacterium]|nr:hypothetical protein [Leptospiraceae bacterium]